MGMYTEFLFQGVTKAALPHEIKELFYYFFDKDAAEAIGNDYKTPDHPFFKCDRWRHIGHVGSYYFSPFSLRHTQPHINKDGTDCVFLLCNIKNYDDEIRLFLEWIDPYMEDYWGHYQYENDELPTYFKVRR